MTRLNESLEKSCDRLKNKICWTVTAGSGTGSVFNLGLGGKIPRRRPLTNRHLTQEQRENVAEYGLFVMCVWRLDTSDRVLCGAWDSNDAEGPMLSGLRQLIGHRVIQISVRDPGLDLELTFDNNLQLNVFCDQTNEQENSDNYSLYLPESVLIAGAKSVLRLEHRQFL